MAMPKKPEVKVKKPQLPKAPRSKDADGQSLLELLGKVQQDRDAKRMGKSKKKKQDDDNDEDDV